MKKFTHIFKMSTGTQSIASRLIKIFVGKHKRNKSGNSSGS